ncbi:TrkA-C domain-containing protein [Halomicrobium zhouii]|uniref:TrkA-C domain-containing protein n=1 Tax=Halomicrobium zhouii TaxID=767519 RepID=A0A1I6KQF3_9EURY|nr:TrkA C-terminal domain-containing protein [Halomicrobium zhouii]SFR93218.1 TrkA-C domain-containing protein [Halomicrobium zhouii]
MASPLPVEILLGIYLGLLVGIIPALVSWGLAFTFKYFAGVTIPSFGVAVLAIALAGVNGGLLAFADKSITSAPNAERVVTAILVVTMASMYAHAKGDQMGAELPRRLSLDKLREKTLSSDVVEFVGGRGEVRVRVVGEVADMEGYPPLSEELRAEIRGEEFTFPADLRIAEIEERFEERLTKTFDLGDAAVAIDERGRASVVAAPPFSGLSKRIDDGDHAVSVDALLPTGLARGDELTVITPDAQARGTVLSARSNEASAPDVDQTGGLDAEGAVGDGEEEDLPAAPVRAPTTDGGEGRLTVGVTRTDAQPLLRASEAKVVVESRGTRREYELVSLLRRADQRFRRLTVAAGGALAGASLGDAAVRDTYGVAVLAVRNGGDWQIAPGDETTLAAGDELYAVGSRDALDGFAEAVA